MHRLSVHYSIKGDPLGGAGAFGPKYSRFALHQPLLAIDEQTALADQQTRAPIPRVIGAIVAGISFPLFRIFKALRAGVTLVCPPVFPVECLNDNLFVTAKRKREQLEIRMLDDEAISP